MLGTLWNNVFGDLDMVKISALIAAASFCLENFWKWTKSRREEKRSGVDEVVMDAVNQAIFYTSKDVGNLGKTATMPNRLAEALLEKASYLATDFAKNRGVDLTNLLGSTMAVKGMVQGAFTEINSALKQSSNNDDILEIVKKGDTDEGLEDLGDGSGSGDGECVREDEEEPRLPGTESFGKQ